MGSISPGPPIPRGNWIPFQSSVFSLQSSVFRFQVSGFRFQSSGFISRPSPLVTSPPLPSFSAFEWSIAVLAALGIGVSKSGLPGLSLLHVALFAHLFPGLQSTGVVLPMLIAGDFGAMGLFRRHTQWPHVARTLPPAVIGVAAGWALMRHLPDTRFSPVIGGIVLALAALQVTRDWRPDAWRRVPHTRTFAWTMGLLAGVTTMLANAAGPVMALYLLAVALPKQEFLGTAAWFFLLINLIKVPFSAQLGLITVPTLAFNALLLPAIAAGLLLGRAVMNRLPQRAFDTLVLAFAVLASLRLIGLV
ncbi:MAG: sulfite exporter TauE/SafE family protein [Verrucomicrobiae bacterium]|nr:sulfite exporter TauE/SafE family protein [Verrucomicrobiae bacterium]